MTQSVNQPENQSVPVCEYCDAVQSRVWRRVVCCDDGTRQEVWCCDECYNLPEEEGGDPTIEVLHTQNGEEEEEIIDLCDE